MGVLHNDDVHDWYRARAAETHFRKYTRCVKKTASQISRHVRPRAATNETEGTHNDFGHALCSHSEFEHAPRTNYDLEHGRVGTGTGHYDF